VRIQQLALILVAAALVAGSLIFHGIATMRAPGIVVYLDKDAKQPAILPLPETMVVTGDRAALWWSVYNKAVERGYGAGDSRYVARDAVEAVYGKAN